MADQLTTNPNAPRDWAGDIVPGALLYTYASGTTTPLTVYADAAATIPHPNPIAADGNGVFPQIFYTGAVKIIVTDPDGVALPGFPLDPAPRSVTDTSGANTISFLPTAAIPETNVQAAIERVQANYEDELGTGVGFLTRGTAPGSLRTRVLSGDGTSISVANGNGDTSFPVFSSVKASVAEAQAGTDTNKSMTAARVEDHMLANALGWGQTWQDVTGSRTHSTYYQNLTGRPIMVALRAVEASGARQVQVSPDGSSTVVVGAFQEVAEGYQFIVPNGWRYRINGSCTITFWSELR